MDLIILNQEENDLNIYQKAKHLQRNGLRLSCSIIRILNRILDEKGGFATLQMSMHTTESLSYKLDLNQTDKSTSMDVVHQIM